MIDIKCTHKCKHAYKYTFVHTQSYACTWYGDHRKEVDQDSFHRIIHFEISTQKAVQLRESVVVFGNTHSSLHIICTCTCKITPLCRARFSASVTPLMTRAGHCLAWSLRVRSDLSAPCYRRKLYVLLLRSF